MLGPAGSVFAKNKDTASSLEDMPGVTQNCCGLAELVLNLQTILSDCGPKVWLRLSERVK